MDSSLAWYQPGGIMYVVVILALLMIAVSVASRKLAGDRWKDTRDLNDEMYENMLFLLTHNLEKANAELVEWRSDSESEARAIWTEEELLERVGLAEDELAQERRVREIYEHCCRRFLQAKQTAWFRECLHTYQQYLHEGIAFRQSISILPLTSGESEQEENTRQDNHASETAIMACRKRLSDLWAQ